MRVDSHKYLNDNRNFERDYRPFIEELSKISINDLYYDNIGPYLLGGSNA